VNIPLDVQCPAMPGVFDDNDDNETTRPDQTARERRVARAGSRATGMTHEVGLNMRAGTCGCNGAKCVQ
jgi:hypothetical protein